MANGLPLQPIRNVLDRDRNLALLLPAAKRLRELDRRLRRILPAPMARACRIVAVTDGEARITCDNGAAASRVRSLATTVARALSTEAAPVDRLRVRVGAEPARPERPAKPGLGHGALAAWMELDRELPDGGLKQAVDGLLRHHRPGR